jgi:hypothetical protein
MISDRLSDRLAKKVVRKKVMSVEYRNQAVNINF